MTAPTRVGSATVNGGTGSATTSGTMSLSALGVQTGDLVIVMCAIERNSTTPGLTIASGVSSYTTLYSTTGSNHQSIVGYFVAQAGDLSATVSGTALAARRIVAAVQVWRGAGTPVATNNASVTNSAGVTSILYPAVTPAVNDCAILAVHGGASVLVPFNARTFTSPSGFTQRVNGAATNTTSVDPYIGFSDETLTGGSGVSTGTLTGTASNGSFEYDGATIVVPPASVALTGSVALSLGLTGIGAVVVSSLIPLALGLVGNPAIAISGSIPLILGVTGVGNSAVSGTLGVAIGVTGSAVTVVTGSAPITLGLTGVALQNTTGNAGVILGLSGVGMTVTTGSLQLILGLTGSAASAASVTGSVGLVLGLSAQARTVVSGTLPLTISVTAYSQMVVFGELAVNLDVTGSVMSEVRGNLFLEIDLTGTVGSTILRDITLLSVALNDRWFIFPATDSFQVNYLRDHFFTMENE